MQLHKIYLSGFRFCLLINTGSILKNKKRTNDGKFIEANKGWSKSIKRIKNLKNSRMYKCILNVKECILNKFLFIPNYFPKKLLLLHFWEIPVIIFPPKIVFPYSTRGPKWKISI